MQKLAYKTTSFDRLCFTFHTYVVYVTELNALQCLPQNLAHCVLVKAIRAAFKVI